MTMLEVLAAVAVGAIMYLPSGYVVAWLVNLVGARRASLARRLLIATPTSVAVLPIIDYWIGRFAGLGAMTAVPLVALVGVLGITLWERERWPKLWRELVELVTRHWKWLLAAVAWAVFVAVALSDMEIDGVLRTPPATIDYQKHDSVTDAICRTGLPPVNPSLYPGRPLPLYYYYLWFLTAAQVRLLSGGLVGTYAATLASAVWAGYALWTTVILWLSRFRASNFEFRISTALLALTGLDLIVLLAIGLGRFLAPPWLISVEWCLTGIAYWLTLVTWVPHHVAGGVACLMGMLALRDGPNVHSVLFAGLAFASGSGVSIWLAFVAAIVIAMWVLACLIRTRRAEALAFVAAGAIGAAAVAPYALDLRSARDERAPPIAFDVRRTAPVDWCLDRAGVSRSDAVRWAWNLPFLPLSYFMEFGVFALGTAAYWWMRRRDGTPLADDDLFQITLAAVPLLVCSFLRSAMHNNDLGWRGVMYTQFVAHLWTTIAVARWIETNHDDTTTQRKQLNWSSLCRRAVVVGFVTATVIGLLGNVYDVVKGRMHSWSAEAADVKAAYGWCRTHTDANAIFQHYPVPVFEFDANDVLHGLYGDRQVALADGHYGRLYGISEPTYRDVERGVLRIFDVDASWEEVREIARQLKIDYLIVRSRAPVWKNRASWVWERSPVYENPNARVFSVNHE